MTKEQTWAAALKKRVAKILMAALDGSEPRYRLDGYIRWGRVEQDIHEAIDAAFDSPGETKP